MKIASIETFTNEYVGFVRVRTVEGDEGWGQVSTYNADITSQIVHRHIAPHTLGQDASDLKGLTQTVLEREHKFPGSYLYRALCGVDTALWDVHGKRAGKSVASLLGSTRKSFPVYASSMRRDITPEEEAERFVALREQFGYTSFKFRVGRECGHDVDQWPGRTEEIVKKVRETLGNDITLLVDANSAYTLKKAIEVGHLLQDYGISHFEEPCPYWELGWTKQVKEVLDLDVSGGEQDSNMVVWNQIIQDRVVDIVQPDICYMGGITRSLEVAKMAEAAKIPCTLHCANLSLVTLFSAHFMAAINNPGKYLEFSIEGLDYYPWQAGLFGPGYEIVNGDLILSDKPGWGIEIDPLWLASADYQVSYNASRF
ncbi:mandelate racemase/muconate lactonizing enzyme family protein [uncultured Kiloniella sp.]|uniref:mandelate racemase/muconate lactonizing enzyme family protein n=1 Tax=uncultured Kiloniella sp. TaxID=1133091 RepID=UPI0026327BCF|nr:mandelate racemase/muconate lactonizing enzyme family protein [uncultured Kiloniella sp.]